MSNLTISGSYLVTDTGWTSGSTGYTLRVDGGVGNSKKRLGPTLFFKYVKSKLTKTQQKKLKDRLGKLQQLVKQAEELNQRALFEELSKSLVAAVREAEAVACGYETSISEKDVQKFMGLVRENDQANTSPVFFKKLEEFPRAIPANVKKAIKSVQSKGIFDELWILYLDYTREEIKTNKEKIRQKDPILFGRNVNDPDKLYFIIDWIDEYCDLTLSKFIDKLKTTEPEYEVSKIEEIDQAYVDRLKKEVQERADRLAGTNRGNFRDLMSEEDRAAEKAAKEAKDKEIADLQKKLEELKASTAELQKALQPTPSAEEIRQELIAEGKVTPKKPWYKFW